ncbi:MAG TPA: outer membrane protein assembly factor BamA [Candidatus Sulfotelmatobacter sp.]|nr:outer membrane protein assembly factor BamA [Candidatus Sulfotelmatobacter sp.]
MVGAITVVGNTITDTTRIIRSFEVVPGTRYSEDAVRRGMRKLFALGVFEDVWVDKDLQGDTMNLVIHVAERRRISRIEFTGQRKKSEDDLKKKLFLHVGESYSPVQTRSQVDTLLKLYRDDGYAQAAIDAVTDTTVGPGQLALRFVIREGEKVRIERITFEGISAFNEARLRKNMKTHQKGFFGGGEVKEEDLMQDKEKLETWYHDHGYRDMRVAGHELLPGSEPRRLILHVKIEEGRPYFIGNVRWEGNKVIGPADLAKVPQPKSGDLYDASKIDRARGEAFGSYAEHGYLYVQIEPQESLRDSLVDITFHITEGDPSNVRYVVISGNKATREKVIRREIDIHEGDRFRRSALMRTRDDIMRLGIFEDVAIDFGPTETSDVDVLLKVKEKQVGTASAGAGYTSATGVTGFVELGHNNVLGNGQSLQLHLERGATSNNYFLSFTEPWFHDTPTLLGISAFNTATNQDLYREKRVGGSVRIGRPLPWPDYSRGSITYRLEGVTLDSLGTLSDANRLALTGTKWGEQATTSSMEFDFLRNTTDNPMYPKRGTRLALSSELAGGPFLGNVNFQKQRVEGRLYMPSILRGITTMMRARAGWLGEFGLSSLQPVPEYERFRLGGGSTIDPLRGYDDYMVVPEKFIQRVRTPILGIVIDSLGVARSDTLGYTNSTVRYPGGRFFTSYTVEQQFPIVNPLHGVFFFDAGNTWDLFSEIKPFDLKMGAGIGFRLEIPLLGNIGFDYGYGFNRDDHPKAVGHFLLGNVNF